MNDIVSLIKPVVSGAATIMASTSLMGERFNDACKGLNDCKSLKRIQKILEYYKSIINQNDNDQQNVSSLLMEYLKTNNYKNMMNDYHHLLLKHLNAEDNTINAQNYAIINQSLSHCKCYDAYNNNMTKSINEIESTDENKEKDDKQMKQEMTALVYVELLNNIHQVFIHGYDIGYRIKHVNDTEINQDDNDYFDKEISSLATYLNEKREALIKAIGLERFQQNRFIHSPTSFVFELRHIIIIMHYILTNNFV